MMTNLVLPNFQCELFFYSLILQLRQRIKDNYATCLQSHGAVVCFFNPFMLYESPNTTELDTDKLQYKMLKAPPDGVMSVEDCK